MYKSLIVAAAMLISACSSGINEVPIPELTSLQSDYPDRPLYGTAADPLELSNCALLPYVSWQTEVCDGRPLNTIWPQSNFYRTGQAPYWTILANNEGAFSLYCNSGPPAKSNEINGDMFQITHPNAESITLKVQQDERCITSPYLAITNTGLISELYGSGIIVNFTVDADFSVEANQWNFYHFYIIFTNKEQKYIVVVYLRDPANAITPIEINWNWPIKDSIYNPNSVMRFVTLPSITKIEKPGTYKYKVNIDEVIKTVYPELANDQTKIIGFEFAVEQTWRRLPVGSESFYTQMTLSNLSIYKP